MNYDDLVTGLVPEELLPLLLKEAAVENAEYGRRNNFFRLFNLNVFVCLFVRF